MPDCLVKICGMTREEDVRMVSSAGADYCGILIGIPSPRSVEGPRARVLAAAAGISVVLLFMDAEEDFVIRNMENIWPHAIQLAGHEPPHYVTALRKSIGCEIWKSVHLEAAGAGSAATAVEILEKISSYVEAGADRILLDTVVGTGDKKKMGGTGKVSDWPLAAEIVRQAPCPVILAGGLNPDNVEEAIRTVKPFAVDLSSGVEKAKGIKDAGRVALFMERVKSATEE